MVFAEWVCGALGSHGHGRAGLRLRLCFVFFFVVFYFVVFYFCHKRLPWLMISHLSSKREILRFTKYFKKNVYNRREEAVTALLFYRVE
jgi:hypothetical protein